jgi:hypothetical protein
MKPLSKSLLHNSACFFLFIAGAGICSAAQINWVGDTNNEFLNAANWPSDTLPSLSADTWQVNSVGSQGNSTLNITGGLTFTGTGGKLAFGSISGNMTLGGGDITIFQGTGGDNIRTDSTGTTTISSNIKLGDGTDAGTGNVTYTLSSTSITTGLLKVTGDISGGTKPGQVTVSFGSTDSIDGNYEVTGDISKGGASAIALSKRGDGTLTLSGTNEVISLSQNVAASKIIIAGGTTSIKPAGEVANNWGGGSFTAGTGPTVEVKTGATLNADYARDIRTKMVVTGGTINIETTAPRLSWGLTNTEVFNMSSGEVNYKNASSGTQYGVGFNNNSGAQSGGTFTVNGRGATTQTFSVTASSVNSSYSLSGGTLDVKGSNSTNGFVYLNSDAAGTYSSTFTLSGTGKLISRFNPGSSSGGIVGGTTGAVQVLSLTGGTLVAGRVDATNLRGMLAGANGTLVNNGTNIAPGDVGTVGRTNIVGNMSVSTGLLTIDLGGLTASTAFSEAANLGTFDNLLISGNLSLGGNLGLNLVNGYTPNYTDIFKIIDISGTLSNFFGNVTDGGTLATLGNEGTFKVYSSGGDVFLTNYTAVPEPRAALIGGLGLLGLLRRRRC